MPTASGSRGCRLRPRMCAAPGAVAEWLRSGLQSRVHRFDSGPRLLTRTCLITGGGSGIGLRLSQLLAGRGERVVALDRVLPAGTEGFEVDVTDAEAVRAAVEQARPRLVINSAGIQLAKPFADLTETEFRRIVDVNLVGSR